MLIFNVAYFLNILESFVWPCFMWEKFNYILLLHFMLIHLPYPFETLLYPLIAIVVHDYSWNWNCASFASWLFFCSAFEDFKLHPLYFRNCYTSCQLFRFICCVENHALEYLMILMWFHFVFLYLLLYSNENVSIPITPNAHPNQSNNNNNCFDGYSLNCVALTIIRRWHISNRLK